MSHTMSRRDLLTALDKELRPALFRDYAPNGLQVEGRERIGKVICGVTASQALIDAAIEAQADAILVHHGYFWRGENQAITGYKAKRIKALLNSNINLFGYHLPLDAHPTLGNNWQLGALLGVENVQVIKNGQVRPLEIGNTHLSFIGDVPAIDIATFGQQVESVLGRQPLVIEGDANKSVTRVAWCTGGAQDAFSDAIAAGADVFLTGEVSERTFHEAKEMGVHFISAGHHATERYGVKALADWLEANFGLEALFIDIDNPV